MILLTLLVKSGQLTKIIYNYSLKKQEFIVYMDNILYIGNNILSNQGGN